jgi:hypothetical protein
MTGLDRADTPHPLCGQARDNLRTWALFPGTVDAGTTPFAIEGNRGAGTRRPSASPAFSLTTHQATRAVGHLPVMDRLHRRWVLVDVAGHLRARRLPVDEVNDSAGVIGAGELVDSYGPLFIFPSDTSVGTPQTCTPFVSGGSENA